MKISTGEHRGLAPLSISADNAGRIYDDPDLGYPRVVQRADGKIVTIYYYATEENPEQHIAATIWDPDKVK